MVILSNMKTVLILGGFGFIGSNIIKYIQNNSNDFEIIVFDKHSRHSHGVRFEGIKKVYVGNFSDTIAVKRIFQENKIDLVIHSISSTVPAKSDDIQFDILTNLIPTVKLLDIIKEFNVKDIVYISSGGAIYGPSDNKHLETDEAFPISSYGVVKLAIEKYLFLFSSQYNLRPLILRPSNIYGLYHYSLDQGIINIALRDAIVGKIFCIWGDGEGEKDYLHVDDFCHILFNLLSKGIHNTVINIGSGDLLSVNEIVRAIKKIIPSFKWRYQKAVLSDVRHVSLDSSRLISYIGEYEFKPFVEGLNEIYNWQKSLK
jgi:UDP-glucose 4-epimerase